VADGILTRVAAFLNQPLERLLTCRAFVDLYERHHSFHQLGSTVRHGQAIFPFNLFTRRVAGMPFETTTNPQEFVLRGFIITPQEEAQLRQLCARRVDYTALPDSLMQLDRLPYEAFVQVITQEDLTPHDVVNLCSASPRLEDYCQRPLRHPDGTHSTEYVYRLLLQRAGAVSGPSPKVSYEALADLIQAYSIRPEQVVPEIILGFIINPDPITMITPERLYQHYRTLVPEVPAWEDLSDEAKTTFHEVVGHTHPRRLEMMRARGKFTRFTHRVAGAVRQYLPLFVLREGSKLTVLRGPTVLYHYSSLRPLGMADEDADAVRQAGGIMSGLELVVAAYDHVLEEIILPDVPSSFQPAPPPVTYLYRLDAPAYTYLHVGQEPLVFSTETPLVAREVIREIHVQYRDENGKIYRVLE
jgi:hypothetical protein